MSTYTTRCHLQITKDSYGREYFSIKEMEIGSKQDRSQTYQMEKQKIKYINCIIKSIFSNKTKKNVVILLRLNKNGNRKMTEKMVESHTENYYEATAKLLENFQ